MGLDVPGVVVPFSYFLHLRILLRLCHVPLANKAATLVR